MNIRKWRTTYMLGMNESFFWKDLWTCGFQGT